MRKNTYRELLRYRPFFAMFLWNGKRLRCALRCATLQNPSVRRTDGDQALRIRNVPCDGQRVGVMLNLLRGSHTVSVSGAVRPLPIPQITVILLPRVYR